MQIDSSEPDASLRRLSEQEGDARKDLANLDSAIAGAARTAFLEGRPVTEAIRELRLHSGDLESFLKVAPSIRQLLQSELNEWSQRLGSANREVDSLQKEIRKARIARDAETLAAEGVRGAHRIYETLHDRDKTLTKTEIATAMGLRPGCQGYIDLMR